MTRVVLVPGALALLPAYRSIEDPVAPLRAACLEALRWLGEPTRVLADAQGERVAAALVEAAGGGAGAGAAGRSPLRTEDAVLVVGNGSARRTDASPGPFDARAVPFDDALAAALRRPDPAALRALDPALAEELWAATGRFAELADLLDDLLHEAAAASPVDVQVDYDDAPFGVQYWVMRWQA